MVLPCGCGPNDVYLRCPRLSVGNVRTGAVLPSGVGTTARWNPLSPERHTAFCIGVDVMPRKYFKVALRKKFNCGWILAEETGCWIWMGAPDVTTGYGSISEPTATGFRKIMAHRASWFLHRGPIPDGMHIDHVCRVRMCVNPDHLRVVTPKQNVLENSLGITARNKGKSHCPMGHPYSGDNLRTRKDGSRQCRTCRRVWWTLANRRRQQGRLKADGDRDGLTVWRAASRMQGEG